MIVYRITTKKWSRTLKGSGYEARWNKKGNFVLYTASTPELAALENLVHFGDVKPVNVEYCLMYIEIPDDVKQTEYDVDMLPKKWHKTDKTAIWNCRNLGNIWYDNFGTLVLKVPSSIIVFSHNYLIHNYHQHFNSVKIVDVKPFTFDERL